MGDWESVFREIDDDYLIGISNKGIVKRAYKDMETTSCELLDSGQNEIIDAIAVKVGEETVQIRMPLGESTCSCPSRSICRHVILGILALQKMAADVDQKTVNKETAEKESDTKETQKINDNEAAEKETVTKETKKKTNEEIAQQPSQNIEKGCEESEDTDNSMTKKVLQQIADYPLEKLCKSLGVRRLQEWIDRARAGKGPQINYSSVVTVQPLAQAMTVKLLSPLEYSTCTCHKKEFCVHKVEAVLWCKLESGQINVDELERDRGGSTEYDMEQIQDVVLQMRTFLEELLDTGLTRTPQDVLDHMERLATICHNAKLPNFESDWRRLQDSYNKYLKRVASLRIQQLMRQLTTFYRQVELLGQAQNVLEVSKLAGAFRAEYTSALDLDLVGIATEHFVSKSGYEGETVYFLEENTKEWYTYTQARPVFYDNNTNTANNAGLRYIQETPWGLSVPLRELAFWHIHLEQAKSDSRGRLSSSKETKGQLIRDRRADKNTLTTDVLGKWYYQDFAQLFEEQFQDKIDILEKNDLSDSDSTTRTKLVFLRPASCDQAVFLETEQKLCMNLYDEAGKAVVVEVVYSRDEAEGIRYLEKITNENLPCFFGKVYLRGGMIRMYPVAVFGRKELDTRGI
ncbi:MAG: SWIM zinc finger family protein [Lachnospiraceae bacterium]|nr:SWIM zinc finger family protein [Lachnospiraceae bacterium]